MPAGLTTAPAAGIPPLAAPQPDSHVAAKTSPSADQGWQPGDGAPAAGKFPPPIKRDLGIDGNPNMENITLAMRDWSYFTDRFPGEIDELVSTKYLPRIPTPPAGKKYIISGASVGLADKK